MNKMLLLFVVGSLMAAHYLFPSLIEARDRKAFEDCVERMGGATDSNCQDCYEIVYGKEGENVY